MRRGHPGPDPTAGLDEIEEAVERFGGLFDRLEGVLGQFDFGNVGVNQAFDSCHALGGLPGANDRRTQEQVGPDRLQVVLDPTNPLAADRVATAEMMLKEG